MWFQKYINNIRDNMTGNELLISKAYFLRAGSHSSSSSLLQFELVKCVESLAIEAAALNLVEAFILFIFFFHWRSREKKFFSSRLQFDRSLFNPT